MGRIVEKTDQRTQSGSRVHHSRYVRLHHLLQKGKSKLLIEQVRGSMNQDMGANYLMELTMRPSWKKSLMP
jgi:hypothetical protein